MGHTLREFAMTSPTVREPMRGIALGMSPDAFHADPERYLPGLYAAYLEDGR
jgi:hypothetical protein